MLLLQLACDFVIILNQLYFYKKKNTFEEVKLIKLSIIRVTYFKNNSSNVKCGVIAIKFLEFNSFSIQLMLKYRKL